MLTFSLQFRLCSPPYSCNRTRSHSASGYFFASSRQSTRTAVFGCLSHRGSCWILCRCLLPHFLTSKEGCLSATHATLNSGWRRTTRFSPFQLFWQLWFIFLFLGLALWHGCPVQSSSTWEGNSRSYSSLRLPACSLLRRGQIALGAGTSARVRGGSIFFNGRNSEHRVAFQQLATLLESSKCICCSYQSRGHLEAVPVSKALHLLNSKCAVTLRWTRTD